MTIDPSDSQFQETVSKYMPFLLEIRRRLFWIAAFFAVGAIIGFIYYQKIVGLAINGLALQGVNLVFTTPFQYFELAVSSAIVTGVIAVVPIACWQIISFLRPALGHKEFHLALTLLPLAFVLFIVGFLFGAVMMKYVIGIFYENSQKLNIGNFLDVSALLSTVMVTSAMMGAAFEFPIVLTVLMHFKVITANALAKQRVFVYLISLLFAIMLPPTDVISDIVLSIPLAILFELTLILNRVILKTHVK